MPTRPGGITRGWCAVRARLRLVRTPWAQEPPPPGPAPRVGPITRRDAAPTQLPGRVPELDALRGLAAVFILVYHFKPHQIPFGWAAVDLFFVLSGYLITGIILREGSQPGFLSRFY